MVTSWHLTLFLYPWAAAVIALILLWQTFEGVAIAAGKHLRSIHVD